MWKLKRIYSAKHNFYSSTIHFTRACAGTEPKLATPNTSCVGFCKADEYTHTFNWEVDGEPLKELVIQGKTRCVMAANSIKLLATKFLYIGNGMICIIIIRQGMPLWTFPKCAFSLFKPASCILFYCCCFWWDLRKMAESYVALDRKEWVRKSSADSLGHSCLILYQMQLGWIANMSCTTIVAGSPSVPAPVLCCSTIAFLSYVCLASSRRAVDIFKVV